MFSRNPSSQNPPDSETWDHEGEPSGFTYPTDAYSGEYSYDYLHSPTDGAAANDYEDWSTGTNQFTAGTEASNYGNSSYFGVQDGKDGFVSPPSPGTTPRPTTAQKRTSLPDEDDDQQQQQQQQGEDGSAGPALGSQRPAKRPRPTKSSWKSKGKASAARRNSSAGPSQPSSSSAGVTGAAATTNGHRGLSLRTASRRSKVPPVSGKSLNPNVNSSDAGRAASPPAPPPSPEHRARHNHNQVEKQYRNRLNAQFERLLGALPADMRHDAGGGSDGDVASPADDRRMSKAEVLDLATRHIRSLEGERTALQVERNGLIEDIDNMQQVARTQPFGGSGN